MNTIKAPSCGRYRPSKVQELLASLQEAGKRVTELQELLALAEIEYNQLETEWFSYEASIAPIRKCPPEITLMVFEFYLLENPRLIRRLLLVCKQWYEIASGAPQLWNHILVEFGDEWNVEAMSIAINRRVELCIQRSGSLPLDLDLDIQHLPYARDKIITRLNTCLRDLVGSSWVDESELCSWTEALEEMDFDPSIQQGALADYQAAHVLRVIWKLIGENGISAYRWRSLDLRLPECNTEVALQIWACLTYPTPNLTRLAVRDFHNSRQEFRDDEGAAFPDLSSLKNLDMGDAAGLHYIGAQNSPLEHLTVLGNLRYWASYSLSRFEQLERLELRYGTAPTLRPAGELKFSFPMLRELILSGEFGSLDETEFRVPKLRSLTIIRRGYIAPFSPTPYHHPILKPSSLRWEVAKEWQDYWTRGYVYSELRKTVLQYPTAERFRTRLFLWDIIVQLVQELHLDGNLPSALKFVTFEGEEGGLETVDLQDLLIDQ